MDYDIWKNTETGGRDSSKGFLDKGVRIIDGK
jgi:hypothetical protein